MSHLKIMKRHIADWTVLVTHSDNNKQTKSLDREETLLFLLQNLYLCLLYLNQKRKLSMLIIKQSIEPWNM